MKEYEDDGRWGGRDAHIHRADRIAAHAPDHAAAPLTRIGRAIFALWMARDNAHIGGWRIAHFPAPHLAILTQLWHGEAVTDNRYFRQWPPLDLGELTRLHEGLTRLIAALPENAARWMIYLLGQLSGHEGGIDAHVLSRCRRKSP